MQSKPYARNAHFLEQMTRESHADIVIRDHRTSPESAQCNLKNIMSRKASLLVYGTNSDYLCIVNGIFQDAAYNKTVSPVIRPILAYSFLLSIYFTYLPRKGNPSSSLTPTVVGGRHPLLSYNSAQNDPPLKRPVGEISARNAIRHKS